MIDVNRETLITLGVAAKRIPGRTSRKAIHKSALYRWAKSGVDGVRLETIPVGGRLFTSEEALQRFCERRAQGGIQVVNAGPTAQARKAIRELERDGF